MSSWAVLRGDAGRLPFPDRSFDIVIGSPPYIQQRAYFEDGVDLGIARDTRAWVEWMLGVTTECLRVSKGLVVWVCAGPTKDRCYLPGPEGLLWSWWSRGGHCYRPVIWHRVGIPGSGSDEWFRGDTEYCLAFKRAGKLPFADNTANGQPPKWAPGGEMSYRLSDGARVNQWGGRDTSGASRRSNGERQPSGRPSHVYKTFAPEKRPHTKRLANGEVEEQTYVPPAIANPGNFLHTKVGGSLMGHPLAHENEAPYPVDVPRWFLASHCPPGGLVLDPFSGSASTGHAALETGRRYVGLDLRMSQCRLGRKRLRTITPGFAFAEEGSPC